MALSAAAPLVALLLPLLLISAVDASYGGGAVFPSGGAGQYGARLPPLSVSQYNSYPSPYGRQTGNYAGGAGYNSIGGGYNGISDVYNTGSGYGNRISSGYNNAGSGSSGGNNVGNSYGSVNSGYNSVGSGYSAVGSGYSGGNSYNNARTSHGGSGGGVIASSEYSVNTPNSALRAHSVHATGPSSGGNHLGDGGYGDNDSNFQYRYIVSDPKTGDAKSQHETLHAGAVSGEYRVLEPNGLMRVVSYTADDLHGFQAHVSWVPGQKPQGASISHQEVTQQHAH